jgi:hypothetical protein
MESGSDSMKQIKYEAYAQEIKNGHWSGDAYEAALQAIYSSDRAPYQESLVETVMDIATNEAVYVENSLGIKLTRALQKAESDEMPRVEPLLIRIANSQTAHPEARTLSLTKLLSRPDLGKETVNIIREAIITNIRYPDDEFATKAVTSAIDYLEGHSKTRNTPDAQSNNLYKMIINHMAAGGVDDGLIRRFIRNIRYQDLGPGDTEFFRKVSASDKVAEDIPQLIAELI